MTYLVSSLFIASVFLSLISQATNLVYSCQDQNDQIDQILILSETQVTLKPLGTDIYNEAMKFTAKRDLNYHPRSNSEKIRYLGSDKGGSRQVVLSAQMIKAAKIGFMQVRGDEDGYWSKNYKCQLNSK